MATALITWTQTQYRAVGAPTTVAVDLTTEFGTQTIDPVILTDEQIGGPDWTDAQLCAAVQSVLEARYQQTIPVTLAPTSLPETPDGDEA